MSTFLPHAACLLWKPELIWLNAVSDAMLACAFFAIAFVLWLFAWRRHHEILVVFRVIFWGVGLFAAMCGTDRLLAILTLWVPAYGLEAAVKGVLAPISAIITAGLLLLLPRFMVMPTRVQLQRAYAALEEETRQRREAEAMVRRFQEIEANEAGKSAAPSASRWTS